MLVSTFCGTVGGTGRCRSNHRGIADAVVWWPTRHMLRTNGSHTTSVILWWWIEPQRGAVVVVVVVVAVVVVVVVVVVAAAAVPDVTIHDDLGLVSLHFGAIAKGIFPGHYLVLGPFRGGQSLPLAGHLLPQLRKIQRRVIGLCQFGAKCLEEQIIRREGALGCRCFHDDLLLVVFRPTRRGSNGGGGGSCSNIGMSSRNSGSIVGSLGIIQPFFSHSSIITWWSACDTIQERR